MSLIFDFNNVFEKNVGESGFSKQNIDDASSILSSATAQMENKRAQMAWRDLPFQKKEIERIIQTAKEINEKYENFVVLGIGGSALGPFAVFKAFKHLRFNELDESKRDSVRFYVEDNIDPERFESLFDVIDIEKTMFNVISKSGKTSETMAQLLFITDELKKRGLKLADHMIATTDEKNGNLIQIAKKENLKTFVIPNGVGGRFSELSPVGLLAAAVCNIDIKALLDGAAYMDNICASKDIYSNPAMMYALLHVLGMKKGYNISVLMPYADSLKYFSDWYAQLWAESLCKKHDLDGNVVCTGLTPLTGLGATDQHSQIQMYTEGPNDKIITLLNTLKFRTDMDIPQEYDYIDDISFLSGHTFGELLSSELAATEYALTKALRPNIRISLTQIDEHNIGQLLYFFEMATAYAGEMMNINTFDQPGVEEGKLATFAIMGKAGFDEKAKEMSSVQKADDLMIKF